MRSDVVRRDPRAARPPDDVAELLARPPDGRRVDDRQELLEVLGEHPVEQRRVAVLERGEADVLLERVGLDPQVLELELDLLVDRQDPVGQQAAQAERLALVRREGQVLGQQPGAEEGRARRARSRAGRPATMSSNGAGRGRTAPGYSLTYAPMPPPPRRAAAARFPLARWHARRRDVHVRRRCRGGHADRPPRGGRLPRRHRPPALRAEGRGAAAAPDARSTQAPDDVLHAGLGRRDVARRRPLDPRRRPRDRPSRVHARERAGQGRGDRGGLPPARARGARLGPRHPADRLPAAVVRHELPDARRCSRGTGSRTSPG